MKCPTGCLREGYRDSNPLGTVPTMVEGELTMTESAGICQYLVDRHGPTDIGLTPKDKDYGLYLNWLHRSDATLTFPQTIVLRYTARKSVVSGKGVSVRVDFGGRRHNKKKKQKRS